MLRLVSTGIISGGGTFLQLLSLKTLCQVQSEAGVVYMQAPPQADGSVPPYVPLTMDMLSGTDESIINLLQQGIQYSSCIVCSMVVAVQVPPQG